MPPLTHVRLATLIRLELFVASGGRLLATGFLPTRAFDDEGGELDVTDRVRALFAGDRALLLESDGLLADDEAARFAIAGRVRAAVERLVAADVQVSNPELLCLHRVKDERDVWFFVNPTFEPQAADVAVRGGGQPLLWDPVSGEERPLPSRPDGDLVRLRLELPPTGSAFVLLGEEPAYWVVGGNVDVESCGGDELCGLAFEPRAFVEVERGGVREILEAVGEPAPAPVVLGGEWRFEAVGGNALVLDELEAAPARAELPRSDDWRPIKPGVYAFQAGEPADAVWYRASFTCEHVPKRLELLVDGFAGSGWAVHLNGVRVTDQPRRSALDCQIGSLDVAPFARPGDNVLELRLELAGEGDGLLDPLKLLGDFELREREGGAVLVRPSETARPARWDEQGYPRFSGEGVYRRTVELPDAAGLRVFLDSQLADDAVEVVVNGVSAGVRLWAPYRVEITGLLRAGENELELRVSNTLGNLLDAPRRSGLTAPPSLVFARPVELAVPEAAAEAA